MSRLWISSVAIVVMSTLAACGDFARHHGFGRDGVSRPAEEGFQPLNLVVDGMSAEKVIADETRRNEVLGRLGLGNDILYSKDSLRSLVDNIENGEINGDNVPKTLRGFSGFTTRQFLAAAFLDQGLPKVRGKITHYYYNDYTGGGYLEVKTIVTEYDSQGKPGETNRFKWAIGVRPNTYAVHMRDDSDPDDVFPGTLKISKAQVEARGLDHKLYATGGEGGIVVLGVYKNGTLVPRPNALYDMDEESCIDLLFKGYPPESELPEQKHYCLGRCDEPAIVNTT